MQSCVIAGNPIKRQEYQQILEAADAVSAVSRALPQINRLTRCDFIDRAFRTILRENCPNIDHRFERMTAAALLSAIGITLASLYFCVCFRCAWHAVHFPCFSSQLLHHAGVSLPLCLLPVRPPCCASALAP